MAGCQIHVRPHSPTSTPSEIEKMSPEVIATYLQLQSPPHLKRKPTATLGHPPPADVSVVNILIIKNQLHTPCNL